MSGVPQGSVVGPILFLIYIQDLGMDMESEMITILKFVDDSKVISNVTNEDDVELIQSNLNEVVAVLYGSCTF